MYKARALLVIVCIKITLKFGVRYNSLCGHVRLGPEKDGKE